MKKLLLSIALSMATLSLFAQGTTTPQGHVFQFLSDFIATNSLAAATSAAPVYGGLTITNAAAAPLGGYTNIKTLASQSGVVPGTNSLNLTWTNSLGVWVIPTNNVPGTVTGIQFVWSTNTGPDLTKDVPLWSDREGRIPMTVITNGAYNEATINMDTKSISSATMACRFWGAASAANTLNLIFEGVPDGYNGVTGANGTPSVWQWGITAAAGVNVVTTNFPMWRFAGCKAIRLRSGTLTTTTAANIGVTIQSLTLTGFPPSGAN